MQNQLCRFKTYEQLKKIRVLSSEKVNYKMNSDLLNVFFISFNLSELVYLIPIGISPGTGIYY